MQKQQRGSGEEDLQCDAPDLLLLEVANALWKQIVRGKLDLRIASQAIEALGVAPIRFHGAPSLFARAFELAAETGRSVYDCSYLALAIRTGRLLVTADRRFYDALQATPLARHLLWVEDVP